jgi:hypothetical protein
MPKKLWRVHVPLKLRYPGTKTFEVAEVGEVVEERGEPELSASSDDVRVYRQHKAYNDFQSFMVSRSELDASAKTLS